MANHAALYIRVSTDDQLEFSPEAQQKALLKYADEHGYFVDAANIFIDEGISGRKAEKRPAFLRMIAKAKDQVRPFAFILVHKFDRFARSREDSVVYKSLLRKECGVRVVSITESLEDDKFSIILEAMLEAMAEYYSINLAEEVKKGMTEKALRGGLQTSPPFGYAAAENRLVPVEEETGFVREIFRRFLLGEGFYSISRWLNSMGVQTHRRNPFESRTVEYILRNPVYIGKLRWNPLGKTRRAYDDEHIILADAAHAPLIDADTWEAAQRRVREVKSQWKDHGRPAAEYKDWLSGLVRCANCESTLIFSKPHYWKCNGYVKGACRSSQHISDARLKEAIFARLGADTRSRQTIVSEPCSVAHHKVDVVSSLQRKAAQLEKKLDRLREAYLEGIETVETYREAKREMERELTTAKEQIAHISLDDPSSVDIIFLIQSLTGILQSDTVTTAKKHKALVSIIDTCTFSKANNLLEITYRDPLHTHR
ncbi:MAG: recombinase family protein [Oscillospiraceae bacterium]|nr:recombinase family protein [Oscillospiraceae bacterium]